MRYRPIDRGTTERTREGQCAVCSVETRVDNASQRPDDVRICGFNPGDQEEPQKIAVACSEGGASKLWSRKKMARDYDLSSTPSDASIG